MTVYPHLKDLCNECSQVSISDTIVQVLEMGQQARLTASAKHATLEVLAGFDR